MALFVFINVLYFVAPPLSDFNLRLVDQVQNHPHSAWALERVEVRAPGITQWIDGGMNGPLPAAAAPYGKRFDERSTSLSKILIVTQVPLVALALLLLHWRRRIYFIDHFAVALHLWTFLLLSIIAIEGVVPTVGRWIVERGWVLNQADATKVWAAALFVLVLLNLVLTLRRSYGQGLPIAVIKSALVLATCVLSHFLYRGFLFVVTFYSL